MKTKSKKYLISLFIFAVTISIIFYIFYKFNNQPSQNPLELEAKNRVEQSNKNKNFDLKTPYLGPNQGTGIEIPTEALQRRTLNQN
jgi:hypothetical protein